MPKFLRLLILENIYILMLPSQNFTELIVWQKAHQLVLRTYVVTREFPREEVYGLTSQFRRAAISVGANIAEGYSRNGKRDKLKFFNYAMASLRECEYYIILGRDLGYASDASLNGLAQEVGKLITAYSKSIKKSLY